MHARGSHVRAHASHAQHMALLIGWLPVTSGSASALTWNLRLAIAYHDESPLRQRMCVDRSARQDTDELMTDEDVPANESRDHGQLFDAPDTDSLTAPPLINREFLAAIDVHLSRFFEVRDDHARVYGKGNMCAPTTTCPETHVRAHVLLNQRLGFDGWLDDYLAGRELRAADTTAGVSLAHRRRLFGCYLTYYGIPHSQETRRALGRALSATASSSWALEDLLQVHQALPLISTDGLLHIARVCGAS